MSRWIIQEDDGTSDGFWMAMAMFFMSVVLAVVGSIIAIFAAFCLVGIIWGTFMSLKNYISGAVLYPTSMGKTISYAWFSNVEQMQWFFDSARDYTHILPALIKPFLVMAGVGVIFVGTVLFPAWIILHAALMILFLPFILVKATQSRH
ncbi:MAG: hypothetical protein IJV22_03285 [Bacteroidales bacterium]|nr:hypothetical protein [Bacteroidales bacterium]